MLFNIAIKNLLGAGIRTWLNVFVTSVSIFMIIFSQKMKKVILLWFAILVTIYGQNSAPAEFWIGYSQEEKIAFINGAYGTVAKLKSHHKTEVRKQYMHDDNWVEPYYIERFYQIADEYLANEIGYNLKTLLLLLLSLNGLSYQIFPFQKSNS